MAKRMTITVETESLFMLRLRSTTHGWCPFCTAEVEMISLENVRLISRELEALEDWLEHGALHRASTGDGSAVICLNSLLAQVQNTKPANRR